MNVLIVILMIIDIILLLCVLAVIPLFITGVIIRTRANNERYKKIGNTLLITFGVLLFISIISIYKIILKKKLKYI